MSQLSLANLHQEVSNISIVPTRANNANTGMYCLGHCSFFSSSCMMLISPEEIFCALQKVLKRLLNDSVLSESCECCNCKGWWKDSLVSLTASFFLGTFLWRQKFEPLCFYQGRVTLLLQNSRQLILINCYLTYVFRVSAILSFIDSVMVSSGNLLRLWQIVLGISFLVHLFDSNWKVLFLL